ncbi:hypothetical protein KIPB_009266, partial [Kipferlia bialata]
GQRIITTSADGSVAMWSMAHLSGGGGNPEPLARIQAHSLSCTTCAPVAGAGTLMVTGGLDRQVKFWSINGDTFNELTNASLDAAVYSVQPGLNCVYALTSKCVQCIPLSSDIRTPAPIDTGSVLKAFEETAQGWEEDEEGEDSTKGNERDQPCMCMSPDGALLAVSLGNHRKGIAIVAIIHAATFTVARVMQVPPTRTEAMAAAAILPGWMCFVPESSGLTAGAAGLRDETFSKAGQRDGGQSMPMGARMPGPLTGPLKRGVGEADTAMCLWPHLGAGYIAGPDAAREQDRMDVMAEGEALNRRLKAGGVLASLLDSDGQEAVSDGLDSLMLACEEGLKGERERRAQAYPTEVPYIYMRL